MAGKATKMAQPSRGRAVVDETYGPMSAYQETIAQTEVWPSWHDGVAEHQLVTEMAPAYATNALHKLGRWQHHLYSNATQKQYEEALAKLYSSPLVDTLIQQALGAFYRGTWLVPHLDDVVQAGESVTLVQDMEEALLEVSITGAVEMEANARESIGARARILYRILAEGITTTEAT